MFGKYIQLSQLRESALMPTSQLVDAPIVSGVRIFETINKTWHADCRITAVSKILDWLVK